MDNKYILRKETLERADKSTYTVNIVRSGCCEVSLISAMTDPEQMIAKVSQTYTGTLEDVDLPKEKVDVFFADQMRTKLTTPLEMLYMVFLVKNVSRALTHQFVRTRIASYAQESMRFLGSKAEYNVLASSRMPSNSLNLYSYAINYSIKTYEDLLSVGISSEDARGVLPTNILTGLFVGISMKTLQHVYEQRMCCQAQPGEWQPILTKMKEAINWTLGEKIASLLSAPYERGEPCGYRASYDRPCVWSNKDAK